MSEPLVIFDFDWSLINENSDTWVFEQLCPALYPELRELSCSTYKGRWTQLMDAMVEKMMSTPYNVTIDQLNEALCSIPVFSETLSAVKLAKENGCTVSILSDANGHYIRTILRYLGLESYISDVVTNHSMICYPDGPTCDICPFPLPSARLHIGPYHTDLEPHGCPLCPPNLCKGIVLDRWRRDESCSVVIYVGDGGGDFCPATRMNAADIILCRKEWTLHKKIQKHQDEMGIAAKVVPWSNGNDILAEFKSALLPDQP